MHVYKFLAGQSFPMIISLRHKNLTTDRMLYYQLNPKTLPRCTLTSPLSEKSLGTLLIAFFEYYGNEFPYETAVISVATASLLDKKQKGWVVRNQPELLSIECPVNRGEFAGMSKTCRAC